MKNSGFEKKIDSLRKKIDAVDKEILKSFKKRFQIAREISRLKKKNGLPLYQRKRWLHVIEDRVKRGDRLGLETEFVAALMRLIHRESIRIQQKVKKEE